MQAQEAVLTIDVGTSACKAALFDARLQWLRGVSVAYERQAVPRGEVCQDADAWIQAVRRAVAQLDIESLGVKVQMIALTSQRETVVPMGRDLRPITPPLLWLDKRGIAEAEGLRAAFGDCVQVWTGLAGGSAYSAGKILWLRRHCPDVFGRIYAFLQPKDYVLYWLSHELATDYTLAARTMLFNVQEKRWQSELLEACGVREDQLPPVYAPKTIVGRLTDAAAWELGLASGIPILLGGGDRPCEVLGSGILPHEVMESSGTTSNMSCLAIRPVMAEGLSCTPHVLDGAWILEQGISASGAVLEWVSALLGVSLTDTQAVQRLLDVAGPGSAGVLMLPLFMGGKGRTQAAEATGVVSGLTLGHRPEHLLRAAVEATAYELDEVLRRLQRAVPGLVAVRVVGGMAENAALNRIKASVYGLPVKRPKVLHAAAYGAFLLAARSLGWTPNQSLRDANPVVAVYTPEPHEQQVYAAGVAAYQALANVMTEVWPLLEAYQEQALAKDGGSGQDRALERRGSDDKTEIRADCPDIGC
ncbi:MAG: hypothetical protein K6T63_11265 [Alicyclobacillus herbarius]|uniref:xylulokinase n=1 Tax=Alicyclobacillus herbarius TaxID=122960 RepID=UPI002355DCA4|nr:FGGY family carbohydrate kinase [Alicyclobacillus herbarius]MCL6633197.1 hypothetical protein [Alicyclobacillus herbarius]